MVLFLLICSFKSFPYPQSDEKKEINLYVDFARFQADSIFSFLEIYFAFDRNAVEHIHQGEIYTAQYDVKIQVYADDSLLNTSQWKGRDQVNSIHEIRPGQLINDLHRLFLSPGFFSIDLAVTDQSNNKKIFKNLNLKIDESKNDSLMVSDVQLALSIKKTKGESKFTKNGYDIIPNPSGIYNPEWPILYFYCEIYNLKKPASATEASYTLTSQIVDLQGGTIKKISEKTRKLKNQNVVEINKTLVSSLVSGMYELRIEVVNNATQEKVARVKRFIVYRLADYTSSEISNNLQKDELYRLFLTKTEEQLDQEFEMVRYIINSDEKNVYQALNLDGKREFFVSFWDLKSTASSLNKSEFRNEYLNRVGIANRRYSYGNKEGWRTDRGRILLIYGVPDNIEKFYGGATRKQYEMWAYHAIEGGVEFFFVDVSNYGNYRLVHSTAQNEVQDYQWRSRYLQ
jgi:GWxTD domain-containing protein